MAKGSAGEPLVSVIIPVYNVEKYIDRCMESVLNQTYRNLEIILVDDGSTDGSGKKCDMYAQGDARVKVIHKENGGLSSARNAGIDVFVGDYITFVDSDDYIDTRLVEKLFHCARQNDCDIAIGGYRKTVLSDCSAYDNNQASEQLFTSRNALLNMFYRRKLPMYAWGKLYKGTLWGDIRFPVGKLFEDTITTYRIMKIVNSAAYIDTPLYYYRQNAGSIVNVGFKPARLDEVKNDLEILQDVGDDIEMQKAVKAHIFFALLDNYAMLDGQHEAEKQYMERYIKLYKKEVLLNKEAGISERIMALLAYFPNLRLLRWLGRLYKKSNKWKWDREARKSV